MKDLRQSLLELAAAWIHALTQPQISPAPFQFRGKTVLVTGGSRGLGLVLARQLTSAGARLALCARDPQELDKAAAELESLGSRPFIMPCDIAHPPSVQHLVHTVQDQCGPIDVLINNAGMILVGPLAQMTRGDFEDALSVNFWGAYNTIEAVLPTMRQRGEGRIVNISSIGGKISVPHLLPYSVSKFALVGYSQGLRAELAQEGIVVTTVCPGLMRTGSPRNALFKGQNELEYAWFSIGDSLPFLTISAEQAASEILQACQRGDAEAVLSLPAILATHLQSLFPEMTSALTALANRFLPGPAANRLDSKSGKNSTSVFAPSFLTTPSDRAAEQNNEMVDH